MPPTGPFYDTFVVVAALVIFAIGFLIAISVPFAQLLFFALVIAALVAVIWFLFRL